MSGWIAVDGGQSSCRVRASWRDDVLDGPGFHYGSGAVDGVLATLEPALRALDPFPAVDAVGIGHTGMPPAAADRTALATAVASRTGARVVHLAPDWATAHKGALGGEPGAVLSAGTGSVALALAADGAVHRVDGRGHLLGDAGSAFSIGRAGLALALRHADGRDVAPGAWAAARRHWGDDLEAAIVGLYGRPDRVDLVARYAPVVIALADDGDPPAVDVVATAAQELARTAAAAARSLPPDQRRLVVTGRLLQPATSLTERFRAALTGLLPDIDLCAARGGSLEGAVSLARDGPGLHAALVHVHTNVQAQVDQETTR